MNKQKLVEFIITQLESDLVAMKEAARATHDAATNEESKPENEYDTRALEASYLAGAQAKRAGEIEKQLMAVRQVEIKSFGERDAIQPTALIEAVFNEKQIWLFLMPGGGGLTLKLDGKSIQVVSPTSPLGDALFGLRPGDDAVIEVGRKVQEYEIVSVQ